jgi:hypothetical protein
MFVALVDLDPLRSATLAPCFLSLLEVDWTLADVSLRALLQATMEVTFNASWATANPGASSMYLLSLKPSTIATTIASGNLTDWTITNANTIRVGERLYIVAVLRTAAFEPVYSISNILLDVKGK